MKESVPLKEAMCSIQLKVNFDNSFDHNSKN